MSRAISDFVEANKMLPASRTMAALFDLHFNGTRKATLCSYPLAIYLKPDVSTYPDWCAESYGPRFHRPSRPQQLWIKARWKIFFYRKVEKWYVNARKGSPQRLQHMRSSLAPFL